MKIRNHRKRQWYFYHSEESSLKNRQFKYKSDLVKYLNNNFIEALCGTIALHEESFAGSYTIRQWFVWYNDRNCYKKANLKIELRQLDFRGSKFMTKPWKQSKEDKKYFAFSDKIISLMSHIKGENNVILPKDAKRLVDLFYKRGFEDFEPNEDDWTYINGHISDGISFWHWSDRCNTLRMKTIIEYFKKEQLI